MHIATAGSYGYQRDELYFLSCARHLAWGYVDQPPLIALIAKFASTVLGDSLYALRLLPALSAAAIVALTGRLTYRLGGGLAAQSIAMLGISLAPFYLAIGNLLTMNAFEPLLWLGAVYAFLEAAETDKLAAWTSLGAIAGLGLINKYSMFFFLGACIVAIAFTPSRRALLRPGFGLAVAIALAIVTPTLVWQARHGWPQLEVLRNAASGKNVTVGPAAFYLQQLLMMNPLAAPLWLAGLIGLLRARADSPLRWYAIAYAVLSVVYVVLGAKVYYLAPIYPVLFAAGARSLEPRLLAVRYATTAYAFILFASGLVIAPEAFPLLPLPAFLAYERVFDVRGIKMEKHPEGRVPQHFADQLGWQTLTATVATAYERLTPSERTGAVILTQDYGQASAIDFFGPKFNLPRAISGHNNYFLYGTHGASGNVVLSIGVGRARLRTEFRRIQRVATYHDDYVLPDFNDLPVYKCTSPIRPLAAWWPSQKRYI
ncbi:MAG: glycosyltransferase family 39 protein [Candidatus Eremiobacteraeota bacterium]|nr:glycosyltransferase family 39 protein [Candidatus Eremiobacteraeota bacterium]